MQFWTRARSKWFPGFRGAARGAYHDRRTKSDRTRAVWRNTPLLDLRRSEQRLAFATGLEQEPGAQFGEVGPVIHEAGGGIVAGGLGGCLRLAQGFDEIQIIGVELSCPVLDAARSYPDAMFTLGAPCPRS